jgi:hypothetical protein
VNCTVFEYVAACIRSRVRVGAICNRFIRAVGAVLFAISLTACALVDTLEPRAETLNRTMTEYRDTATLLNIVRASRNDPMNFVALTGTTAHGTLTGNEGLPSFIVGPHTAVTAAAPAVPARNWTFGPNSLTESASNDFTISVLDDPASYAALLTPMDLAIMGFFIEQHWPMSVLLPIFTNNVRVIDGTNVYEFDTNPVQQTFVLCHLPSQEAQQKLAQELACAPKKISLTNPDDQSSFAECASGQAYCLTPAIMVFEYLIAEGLLVEVPSGAVPGVQDKPYARICFDPVYGNTRTNILGQYSFDEILQKKFGLNRREFFGIMTDEIGFLDKPRPRDPKLRHSRCDDPDTPWTQPTNSAQVNLTSQPASNPTTAAQNCTTGTCTTNKSSQKTPMQNSRGLRPVYELYDLKSGTTIQFATRSTWAIYQYLGSLIARQQSGEPPILLWSAGFSGDHTLFTVVTNGPADCFVSVTYSGANYCVPNNAYNSKMLLSLLHELANLQTRPNNNQQPNTGTTRITP